MGQELHGDVMLILLLISGLIAPGDVRVNVNAIATHYGVAGAEATRFGRSLALAEIESPGASEVTRFGVSRALVTKAPPG